MPEERTLRERLRLEPDRLRVVCDPVDFNFQDTSEVSPSADFIGQERAVEALRLGLGIDSPDHSGIFVTGPMGTGRRAVMKGYLEGQAKKREERGGVFLQDFCYVYNFQRPDEPKLLIFKRGDGQRFAETVENILKSLQKDIPSFCHSEELTAQKHKIQEETNQETNERVGKFRRKIRKKGFDISQTDAGLLVIALSRTPNKDGSQKPMEAAEHDSLSEEDRRTLDRNLAFLQRNLIGIFEKINELRKSAGEKMAGLETDLIKGLLDVTFNDPLHQYNEYPAALTYFNSLKDYTEKNFDFFRPQEENHHHNPMAQMFGSESAGYDQYHRLLPFKVNVLVDNGKNRTPPVIFETNPAFANLFGLIKRRFFQGAYFTDHTQIKAGVLALADQGYLVVNALDILSKFGAWKKLENTLRTGNLKIEEPLDDLGVTSSHILNPEPIPVKLKVIVMGPPFIYQMLAALDPDFRAVFKVKAEFDSEMNLTKENLKEYAQFIAFCCQKEERRQEEKLLPFDAGAVAKIAEEGLRIADNQKKLTTRFDEIKELVVEANYWAREAGSRAVAASHVKKAIEARISRLNLAEEKGQEFIDNGVLLISTKGREVGQINGLSVLNTGDYSFGRPTRITAETFLGNKGAISIDREVKMAGPIHNKGVLILSGYFGKKYGQEKPVSFSATLCFEQSYGGIEGDSASAAEIFSLLSSLSRKPIDQALAVTGSVNQKGEIQPIGGVNQKIEGFFKVCKAKGLDGSHGVIIPHQNVQHLMLRDEVVEAVAAGKFSVWPIKTIDEGIELLMGEKADVVHQIVGDRLAEMFEKQRIQKQAPNES